MKTQVTFRNIQKLEHLEEFARTKTEEVVDTFVKNKNYRIHIRVEAEGHRTDSRRPIFQFEVVLSVAGRRNDIVVKKTSDNFYDAVSKTEHALKKLLRRDAACLARHAEERGHDYVVDYEIAV